MEKRSRSITVREVETLARKPGRHSVGDGLLFVVQPSGASSWLARVRAPGGKRRDIGLGRYPDVSLAEAREQSAKHRKVAREGVDPVARKRELARVMPTFAEACETAFAERASGFRNAKHGAQWIGTLRDFAFPTLGALPVDQVDVPAVVRTMKPLWLRVPETARRVLQRIATVIAWAAAHGHRDHELPVRAIRMGLPPQPKKSGHHAAVAVEDAPAIWRKLGDGVGAARQCLRLLILTGARSREARGTRWDELDLEKATWTVPADRMKAGAEHIVPLSKPALSLLRSIPRVDGAEYVFPGLKKGKPIVDAAVSKVMREAAPGMTVHGWRSTFRDWAAERTSVPGEVAEAALAHTIQNKVEAAYRRTKYLDKRRHLMDLWADYLEGESAKVVPIGRRAG